MSYGQPPYQPQQPQQYSPYSAPNYGYGPQNPYGPQPPRRGGFWKWLLILGGVGGVLTLFCCGSCGWLMNVGMAEKSQDLRRKIAEHPAVVEHIGEITSLDINWQASFAHDDTNTLIYDIVGSKGSGRVTVKEPPGLNSEMQIESATLELDGGDEHELLP